MDPLKITAIVFQCVNLLLWLILIILMSGPNRESGVLGVPWAALSTLIIFTFIQMDKNNYLMLHLSLIPTYICVIIWVCYLLFPNEKE